MVWGGCFGLLVPSVALAVEPAQRGSIWLEVARAPGSEACPDAGRVFAAAASLFPDQPLQAAPRADEADLGVTVIVEPADGEGHVARLEPRGHANLERVLVDSDPACRGLADALAVALVVWKGSLLSASSRAEAAAPANDTPTEEPLEPQEPPRVPPSERPKPAPKATMFEPLVLGAEVGAIGAVGLLGEPSVGVNAGISIWSNVGAGARLRLLRAVALSAEVAPGSVDVDLWAGLFAGCFRFPTARRWSFAPCAELGWGRQHARAEGLVSGGSEASARWAVAGANLAVSFLIAEPFAVVGTGAAFARVHDQRYLVDGEAVARQPSAGGYLGLGVLAEWALPNAHDKAGDRRAPAAALKTDRHDL